jgi:hypothetical protein
MAYIVTRIQTGDYNRWRPMFDQDKLQARDRLASSGVLGRFDDLTGPLVLEEAE